LSLHFGGGQAAAVAADVRVAGRLPNAVGAESMLEGRVQTSGDHATVGLHLGTEVEVLPGRARVRLGGYREPSRFEDASARGHVTGGFELRLFQFHMAGVRHASLSYAFDLAQGYDNNFLSFGLWNF
jgi:hypothetical protein